VEFIGLDILPYCFVMSTKEREKVYRNIKKMKDQLDGILVFGGHLDHELTSFGLPVVMVRSLLGLGDWEKGILNFYKGEKLVSSCLSDFDISQSTTESRFEELLDKIKLMLALKKVRETRLLVVQEKENLGNYDILGMDFHSPLPKDYNTSDPWKFNRICFKVKQIK